MTLAQLARITKVAPNRIRRYCALGIIGQTVNGQQSFAEEDIHPLKIIHLIESSGYKVRDLLDIISAKTQDDHQALHQQLEKLRTHHEQISSQQRLPVKPLKTLIDELKDFIESP